MDNFKYVLHGALIGFLIIGAIGFALLDVYMFIEGIGEFYVK